MFRVRVPKAVLSRASEDRNPAASLIESGADDEWYTMQVSVGGLSDGRPLGLASASWRAPHVLGRGPRSG